MPVYYVEEHPIEFTSLDPANTYFRNNFTDWFHGVQFRFDNYWAEEPLDGYVGIDTIQFYNAAGNYNEKLDSVFTPISFGNFEIPSGDITLSFWSDGFKQSDQSSVSNVGIKNNFSNRWFRANLFTYD